MMLMMRVEIKEKRDVAVIEVNFGNISTGAVMFTVKYISKVNLHF